MTNHRVRINGHYFRTSSPNSNTPTPTPTPPPPPSGTAPPALSDIVWTQPYALPPIAPVNWYGIYVGYATPVNGIGPFTWSLTSTDLSEYRIDPANGSGWVYLPFNPIGTATDTITLVCTDGRGASVSKTVTIQKTDGSVDSIFGNLPNPAQNSSLDALHYGPFFQIRALFHDTPNVPDGTFTLNVAGTSTTSPVWGLNGDLIRAKTAASPPPGLYPLTATWTSKTLGRSVSMDYTIQIVPFTPISFIEFTPKALSTALPVGYVLGKALATTPNNKPVWTLIDSTNTLQIDANTGIVSIANAAAVPGTLNYQIQVTDQSATYTQNFSQPILSGTILDPSYMSMTVSSSLTNYSHQPNANPRAVGTPTVTGFPSGATLTWFIKNSRYNKILNNPAIQFSRGWDRFRIDAATGVVTAQGYLSAVTAPDDWIELTATDGVNACTKRFTVPVAAVTGPVYHVGRGQTTSAPGGTTGFEHLAPVMAKFIGDWTLDYAAVAGATVYIHYDSDPNYYAGDMPYFTYVGGHYDRGMNGPIKFIGVPDVATGALPRIGGTVGTSARSADDQKAFFTANDGDFEFRNLELSFVLSGIYSGDWIPSNGYSGIRWNSDCSGSLLIDNCYIHDCDDLIKTGSTDGRITITNTMLANGSFSTTGSGNNHNAYIGDCYDLVVDNVLSYNASPGHAFKSRAYFFSITNSRFYDGSRGSESAQLDLPNTGTGTVDSCIFWKGSQPQAAFSAQVGAEVAAYDPYDDPLNNYVVTFSNCTFVATSPDGLLGAGLAHFAYRKPTTGVHSSVLSTNNTFYGYTSPKARFWTRQFLKVGDTYDGTVVSSGDTLGTGIPTLSFTQPTTFTSFPRPGWFNAIADTEGHPNFANFNGSQVDPGVDQITVPKGSAIGTTVFTPTAYGVRNYSLSPNAQPDPNINPFITGSVWAKTASLNLYGGGTMGLAQTKYNIDATTGVVTVASVDSTAGFDLFGISCTSPASTNSQVVYYIAAICRV